MKFIYLDAEGKEIGPVDESAVVQAVLSGELTAESPIRNALLRSFRTVAEFECFADALAQAAPAIPEDEMGDCLSLGAYLRQKANERLREEQNRVITAKFFAADAKVLRRLLAMLLDVLVLLPLLLVIFIPSVLDLKFQGEQDVPEIARQRKAHEIQLFTSRSELYKQDQNALTADAEAALEKALQKEQEKAEEKRKSTVNLEAINKMLPGVLKKMDKVYQSHNEHIEKESKSIQDGSKQPQGKNRSRTKVEAPTPAQETVNQELAEYEASKKIKKVKKPQTEAGAAYEVMKEEDRPQVLLGNMPGGEIMAKLFPTMILQWEDRFYADGITVETVDKADALRRDFALRSMLITGYSKAENNAVRLRTGGDVRKLSCADLTVHFAAPLKWTALILLAYYTLALSIFAQTVGMWFWGIFLTRNELAEVLPLRALLYTVAMLIFGIFMIPAVLITKRSVADWLCGVRQVRVGSVSKSS